MRLSHILLCAAVAAAPVQAADLPPALATAVESAEVVLLGETHDNPDHHRMQAEIVAAMAPRAVVWEMLTGDKAGGVDAALIRDAERLERALHWAESHWPDFAMYLPIFEAAPEARHYGGEVPREAARNAMRIGAGTAFGADAARYGLTVGLPPAQQAAREAMQMRAHCAAIPQDMLPGMVAIQRLRDAVLARAVLRALDETGGPVAVITGNGHARRDWGIPVYLDRVRPGLRILAVGQSERGAIDGAFDVVLDSPPAPRADPCAAFERSD